MIVNNGHRVPVSFGDFEGHAGIVTNGGETTLAYLPNRKGGDKPVAGTEITAMDRQWLVLARNASKYVSGMVVLTIQAVTKR
jgi:hypothetical protein